MKTAIIFCMILAAGFLSCGQRSKSYTDKRSIDPVETRAIDGAIKDSAKAGLAEAIETGTIYQSASPYHNDLHEFTYQTALRDVCEQTLSEMGNQADAAPRRYKELDTAFSIADIKIRSSKYKHLKIEPALYEVFVKQVKLRYKK